MAELALWKVSGVDPAAATSGWYREIGQGMGAALNTASAMNGYVLADRGTWLAFKNRGDLTIAVEGDKRLFNQYGVMAVDADRFPHLKRREAETFVNWLTGAEGQKAIADYRIGGEQLFFPNADQPGA
jgi:tungstate transport system substrate-binding protein